MDRTDWTNHQW